MLRQAGERLADDRNVNIGIRTARQTIADCGSSIVRPVEKGVSHAQESW
jgi:hypothetical protein